MERRGERKHEKKKVTNKFQRGMPREETESCGRKQGNPRRGRGGKTRKGDRRGSKSRDSKKLRKGGTMTEGIGQKTTIIINRTPGPVITSMKKKRQRESRNKGRMR